MTEHYHGTTKYMDVRRRMLSGLPGLSSFRKSSFLHISFVSLCTAKPVCPIAAESQGTTDGNTTLGRYLWRSRAGCSARMLTHTHTHTHTHLHTHTRASIHIHIHMYTCTHVQTHAIHRNSFLGLEVAARQRLRQRCRGIFWMTTQFCISRSSF